MTRNNCSVRNITPKNSHVLSNTSISKNALKTVNKIQQAGFEAYLVGGCVRDLLLGIQPKDFDIVSNAKPEQIQKIFSNCRLIGRRFRLAHIYYSREVIEIATYRAHHNKQLQQSASSHDISRHSATGLIIRDNVYGSIEEDAARRDLTINALYYNPSNMDIISFSSGLEDLTNKSIRIIGDAHQRYQEDPVRILRALRFASKLNFNIEAKTLAAIEPNVHLLKQIAPARMFDECLKLFQSSSAPSTMKLIIKFNVFRILFPQTYLVIPQLSWAIKMIDLALHNTAERIQQNKPVTPAFLFAVLLWPAYFYLWDNKDRREKRSTLVSHKLAEQVIRQQIGITAIPRRFSIAIKEIWEYQLRLPNKRKRQANWLISQRRFRAAFDFLLLREQSGETKPELGDWWENYQKQNDHLSHSFKHAKYKK